MKGKRLNFSKRGRMGKNIYDKYIGQITCAYKEDVVVDKDGHARVTAQRTKQREKYIFQGIGKGKDPVLIECPKDVMALEFEGKRAVNEEIIKQIEKKLRQNQLDYCVADHGGTSPYIYLWNLMGLPEGYELEAKKFLAQKLVPEKYLDLLDVTNLGKTLIPVIGLPHWKPKYKGAIHEIIREKHLSSHYNPVGRLLLDFSKPKPRSRVETDDECELIKGSLPLPELLKHYGVDISRNPTRCLWHESKHGRCLSYNEITWNCFHCGESGNIFHFVMRQEGIDFLTAKKKCAEIAGIELKPKEKKSQSAIGTDGTKAISSFTDYNDMARRFLEIQPLYFDKVKIWWFWNFRESRWEIFDETDLMNLVDKHVNITGSNYANIKQPIMEALRKASRLNEPKKAKETWVQFKDKIVDIETGEEFKATAKHHITNPIPWSIGNSEDTPTMDRIFTEWVGEKYVQTLYEILSFCIIPSYFLHRIFCLTGSGSNGKTKFLGLIRNFVGNQNIASSELDALVDSRFETAKLYRKLVCLMGETNFSAMKKTSLLKRLSGEDMIGYEFKNKNPFDDLNYAKIIIATNTLPTTYDKTEGFYRRWIIIEFPNKFTETKDILKDIPTEEYSNLAKKSIRVVKTLWKDREFTNEGNVEERRRRYEEKSNPLGIFIKEECVKGVNEDMPLFVFYDGFLIWLQKRGYRKISKRELGNQLDEEGYEREKRNVSIPDGKSTKSTSWRYILGLRLKSYKEEEFGGVTYIK